MSPCSYLRDKVILMPIDYVDTLDVTVLTE